jgi:hypothetical protein
MLPGRLLKSARDLLESDFKDRMQFDSVRRNAFLPVNRIVKADARHGDRNVGLLLAFDLAQLGINVLAHLNDLILKNASFHGISAFAT